MGLRNRFRSVFQPEIRTDAELATYVVGVTATCLAVAVVLDVVNQLTFFIDWEASVRSWVITAFIATAIAAPVALAIGRAHLQLYRAKLVVEKLSRTDPLTGLLNRRALLDPDDGMPADIMALVIADIDRFKAVNDTHGHLAGDEVIKMVAAVMVEQLGAYGRIGRVGGEEFALLARTSEANGLIDRLWDFRDRIAATPIIAGSTPVKVTISVGVASRQPGQTLDELFAEADRALYLAKAGGRNRVVSVSQIEAADVPAPERPTGDGNSRRQYREATGG